MVKNGHGCETYGDCLEIKRQKQVTTWVMRCNTVVSPSGNINSNNYNNSNGVRPTWITGRQSKRKAEISKDTSKCITFPEWINIKEQKQWIKKLLQILRIYIVLTRRLKAVKNLTQALQGFLFYNLLCLFG